MVNSVQGATGANVAKSVSTAAGAANAQQDRFLQLLVTQMKNQDPLNPMDNAQVTSQMAQLSTVSGIDKLNSTVQALSDSMTAAQTLSATSMIGHGVLVPGSSMALNNGQAIGGLELPQGADTVKVQIKDGAGNLVRTLQFGSQKTGVMQLAWDGKNDKGAAMPGGTYQISANALAAGAAVTASPLSFGVVGSVMPGVVGAKLDVGALGAFNLSAVKQVL